MRFAILVETAHRTFGCRVGTVDSFIVEGGRDVVIFRVDEFTRFPVHINYDCML